MLRKPLMTSSRKCHMLKPENSNSGGESNTPSSVVAGSGWKSRHATSELNLERGMCTIPQESVLSRNY